MNLNELAVGRSVKRLLQSCRGDDKCQTGGELVAQSMMCVHV